MLRKSRKLSQRKQRTQSAGHFKERWLCFKEESSCNSSSTGKFKHDRILGQGRKPQSTGDPKRKLILCGNRITCLHLHLCYTMVTSTHSSIIAFTGLHCSTELHCPIHFNVTEIAITPAHISKWSINGSCLNFKGAFIFWGHLELCFTTGLDEFQGRNSILHCITLWSWVTSLIQNYQFHYFTLHAEWHSTLRLYCCTYWLMGKRNLHLFYERWHFN